MRIELRSDTEGTRVKFWLLIRRTIVSSHMKPHRSREERCSFLLSSPIWWWMEEKRDDDLHQKKSRNGIKAHSANAVFVLIFEFPGRCVLQRPASSYSNTQSMTDENRFSRCSHLQLLLLLPSKSLTPDLKDNSPYLCLPITSRMNSPTQEESYSKSSHVCLTYLVQ